MHESPGSRDRPPLMRPIARPWPRPRRLSSFADSEQLKSNIFSTLLIFTLSPKTQNQNSLSLVRLTT